MESGSGYAVAYTMSSSGKAAVMYNRATGYVTVADPSQTSGSVTITVHRSSTTKNVTFVYPTKGLAGSSVTKSLPCCYYAWNIFYTIV